MALDLSGLPGIEIRKPKDVAKSPTFLFYGLPKSGKTTLAASAALVEELSPVLVIDFEGGTESLAGLYDVDVIRITNYEQGSEFLPKLLTQDHGYKTVVLDPVNAFQKQLQDQIVRKQKEFQPSAKANNSLGERSMLQADWMVVGDKMRKLFEGFHNAPFVTIFTAHAEKDKDPNTGALLMEPMMQGKISKSELGRIPTIIGYVRMVEEGGNVFPVVRFGGGRGIIAGDRLRVLDTEEKDPTMRTIWGKIKPVLITK